MFVLPVSRSNRLTAAPSLSRAIDQLFDTAWDPVAAGATTKVRTPALDVTETDTDFTLALDVPGVSREQLKVSVLGRRVSVDSVEAASPPPEATAPAAEAAAPAERVLYRERAAARYARTISLPSEVDQGASQARFENGVLTLTLRKKVASGATQLTIL